MKLLWCIVLVLVIVAFDFSNAVPKRYSRFTLGRLGRSHRRYRYTPTTLRPRVGRDVNFESQSSAFGTEKNIEQLLTKVENNPIIHQDSIDTEQTSNAPDSLDDLDNGFLAEYEEDGQLKITDLTGHIHLCPTDIHEVDAGNGLVKVLDFQMVKIIDDDNSKTLPKCYKFQV